AIGNAVAGLILLDHQPVAPNFELMDCGGLNHLSLPFHQSLNPLQCSVDTLVEPRNLVVISDVAVRRCLSRSHEGVVLPCENCDFGVLFVQVSISHTNT